MQNELLLIASVFLCFGGLMLFYQFFGRAGLFAWIVIATILGNIEVMILVRAFGMEQTLGNVIFATTLTATDLLSELYGQKSAKLGVRLGIGASVVFLILSTLWKLYIPSPNDFAMPAVKALFSLTPRLVLTSLLVYALIQYLDVWLYHKIWAKTARKTGSKGQYLWLRSAGAALISQLVNAVLFNYGAFWGVYEGKVLFTLVASTFLIYFAVTLASAAFVYLARKMTPRENIL